MEYLAHPNLETRKYYTKSWKGRSKGLSLLEYVYEFSDLRVTEREYSPRCTFINHIGHCT